MNKNLSSKFEWIKIYAHNFCDKKWWYFSLFFEKLEYLPGDAFENAHMPYNFCINQSRIYSVHGDSCAGQFSSQFSSKHYICQFALIIRIAGVIFLFTIQIGCVNHALQMSWTTNIYNSTWRWFLYWIKIKIVKNKNC